MSDTATFDNAHQGTLSVVTAAGQRLDHSHYSITSTTPAGIVETFDQGDGYDGVRPLAPGTATIAFAGPGGSTGSLDLEVTVAPLTVSVVNVRAL